MEHNQRYSKKNKVLPIFHGQFVTLAEEFQEAAKKSFGTKIVNTVFTLRNAYKAKGGTFYHEEEIEYLKAVNKKNTTFTTNNLSDVTKDLFNEAVSVEINIRPKQESEDRPSAWGNALIKDMSKKKASFYIQ